MIEVQGVAACPDHTTEVSECAGLAHIFQHESPMGDHARWQAKRRGLDEATVLRVAESPEEIVPIRSDREVRQGVMRFAPDNKPYLLRVFVDLGPREDRVVTVYRTSKISKYRRSP